MNCAASNGGQRETGVLTGLPPHGFSRSVGEAEQLCNAEEPMNLQERIDDWQQKHAVCANWAVGDGDVDDVMLEASLALVPDLLAERDNLRRVNAELLAALAYMVSSVLPFTGQDLRDTSLDVAIKTARAAIVHAEEK